MLKFIGNTPIQPTHRASCHCGAVILEIDLPDGLPDPFRCNCSFCRRRSAVMSGVPKEQLRVIQGQEALKLYQFKTQTAKHYFCGNCGIYTHHQRRSNPNEYGFNVACLDGVNPYALTDLPTFDGIHHPLDHPPA